MVSGRYSHGTGLVSNCCESHRVPSESQASAELLWGLCVYQRVVFLGATHRIVPCCALCVYNRIPHFLFSQNPALFLLALSLGCLCEVWGRETIWLCWDWGEGWVSTVAVVIVAWEWVVGEYNWAERPAWVCGCGEAFGCVWMCGRGGACERFLWLNYDKVWGGKNRIFCQGLRYLLGFTPVRVWLPLWKRKWLHAC